MKRWAEGCKEPGECVRGGPHSGGRTTSGVVRAMWWWTRRVVLLRDVCCVEGALRERWRDCAALRGEFSAVTVMSLAGVVRSVGGWAGLVTSACGVASRGEGRVRWHAECPTGRGEAAVGEGVCA